MGFLFLQGYNMDGLSAGSFQIHIEHGIAIYPEIGGNTIPDMFSFLRLLLLCKRLLPEQVSHVLCFLSLEFSYRL